MLENRSIASRLLARLVLVGLVLRVAVPGGFMPADLDDGWFLKLCPDGMPMSVMMALLGHDHHHHHDDSTPYQQCDLGGGLADEDSLHSVEQLVASCLPASTQATIAQVFAPGTAASVFQARAPPHSRTA